MFFREIDKDADLGDTLFPNLFIDLFIPSSNEVCIKVYLIAYRQLFNINKIENFNNNTIASILNISLSEVMDAWYYWESKNVVKIHKNNKDIAIEFLDIKKLYVQDLLFDNTDDDCDFSNMFSEIEKIRNNDLEYGDRIFILETLEEYNCDAKTMIAAFDYINTNFDYEMPIKYVQTVLNDWNNANSKNYSNALCDNKIVDNNENYKFTPLENSTFIPSFKVIVDDSFSEFNKRENLKEFDDLEFKPSFSDASELYKYIASALDINRDLNKSEKTIVDTWIDDYNMDSQVIIEACSRTQKAPKPSISYMSKIIDNWHKNNVKTLYGVDDLEKRYYKRKQNESSKGNNMFVPKNKFHNENQTFKNYEDKELEKLLRDSQKGKFK